MSTIFEKIISKEIPANIVYEDDIVLAFLDIKPVNLGHTLVIPKEPSVDGTETQPDTLAHIMKVAQKIAVAQKKVLGATGVNFIMNNGADAGQEVFHTHLHVMPRFANDGKVPPALRDDPSDEERQETRNKLAAAL